VRTVRRPWDVRVRVNTAESMVSGLTLTLTNPNPDPDPNPNPTQGRTCQHGREHAGRPTAEGDCRRAPADRVEARIIRADARVRGRAGRDRRLSAAAAAGRRHEHCGRARPHLWYANSIRTVVARRGKLPCASGTYSTQEAGTHSPYVQNGGSGASCQLSPGLGARCLAWPGP
jgi:hypothetical protein